MNAFHEQFHYCPFIFFSYCIVGLNVLFLWSSLTIRLSLASPQQAIAASAHLFPPHRQAGMKHLLLHNQIPTVMISWAKQILSIMQFSQPSWKGKPYTNLLPAFPGWEVQEGCSHSLHTRNTNKPRSQTSAVGLLTVTEMWFFSCTGY